MKRPASRHCCRATSRTRSIRRTSGRTTSAPTSTQRCNPSNRLIIESARSAVARPAPRTGGRRALRGNSLTSIWSGPLRPSAEVGRKSSGRCWKPPTFAFRFDTRGLWLRVDIDEHQDEDDDEQQGELSHDHLADGLIKEWGK